MILGCDPGCYDLMPENFRCRLRHLMSVFHLERIERDLAPDRARLARAGANLHALLDAPKSWFSETMMCTPSIIDLVARSHSATTSTSPVPSASMAFSSCGRPLVALPDAFSR